MIILVKELQNYCWKQNLISQYDASVLVALWYEVPVEKWILLD